MSLPRARVAALIRAMAGKRVLVVGDVMLDEFVWGRVARISPEAPVPVVEVVRRSYHAGGAANVAANVRALGGRASLLGVVGQDPAAARLRDELRATGIDASLAASDAGRPTTVKTRIIAHHQQVVRADLERSDPIGRTLEEDLLARAAVALDGAQAIVVSDYSKGVVTPRVMKALLQAARRRRVSLLVDPKLRHLKSYRGATLVTPNHAEAEQATGMRIRTPDELDAAGARLLRRLGCGAALITRGEQGMSLYARGRAPVHIPATAREVFDVTGAGDTVIATIALADAAGANLVQAARLANLAAGVVVGKLGTATATPQEVLRAAARS
jgi:D-beta-D-heptose 7-phosphate kinase/D-beta-D-heptose 1-phosphate adenosyltransferase